jgi:hypothetical protein
MTELEFEPRRGQKDATYTYTTLDGRTRELKADEDGVIWPKTAEDEVMLDTLDLPVARKAAEAVTRTDAPVKDKEK